MKKFIVFEFDKYDLGIEFKNDMHIIDLIQIIINFCESTNIKVVREGVLKNIKIEEKESD